ncbi:DUF5990 family protein [Streptomyces sp. AP-93]|uniref:DUF5990 family protein n=1 Tax=Streptomyces sp. AP-93 TaxID=2929048 RepID=UPI0027E48328|nr:DUF5990 family protein [Streptomyces sp. AP-93]
MNSSTPGDAASATWTLECTTTVSSCGINVKGPYVQGRRRSVHLPVMGAVDEAGAFTMFRRAKLMIDGLPAEVLDTAAQTGLLVGSLGLDARRAGHHHHGGHSSEGKPAGHVDPRADGPAGGVRRVRASPPHLSPAARPRVRGESGPA